MIDNCLESWGITNKLMAKTSDNGAGMKLSEEKLNGVGFHLRCMAHVLNLAAKAEFNGW